VGSAVIRAEKFRDSQRGRFLRGPPRVSRIVAMGRNIDCAAKDDTLTRLRRDAPPRSDLLKVLCIDCTD